MVNVQDYSESKSSRRVSTGLHCRYARGHVLVRGVARLQGVTEIYSGHTAHVYARVRTRTPLTGVQQSLNH